MKQGGKTKQAAAARKWYYKSLRTGLPEMRKCLGTHVPYRGKTKESPLSVWGLWKYTVEQSTSLGLSSHLLRSSHLLKQPERSFVPDYHPVSSITNATGWRVGLRKRPEEVSRGAYAIPLAGDIRKAGIRKTEEGSSLIDFVRSKARRARTRNRGSNEKIENMLLDQQHYYTSSTRAGPGGPSFEEASTRVADLLFDAKLECMEFGDTQYPLRNPVEGIYSPIHGIGVEFHVQEFSPYFTGHGQSPQQAYRDWLEQVHVAFQELYKKRPFEMTEQERAQWKALEQAIDVAAYERQTPLVLREIGRLDTARPDPYKIAWMDSSADVVTLDAMPGEFARFKPGQWFEAIVERDRPTGRLRKVRHVQVIDALEPMSGSELEEFWKELPTTATLPRSNRDWTTR